MAPRGTWERVRAPAARDRSDMGGPVFCCACAGGQDMHQCNSCPFLGTPKAVQECSPRQALQHTCISWRRRRSLRCAQSLGIHDESEREQRCSYRSITTNEVYTQHLRAFLRTAQSLHHCLLRMRMKAWQHRTRLRCTAKQSLLSTHGMPARTQPLNMPHSTASGCVLPSAGQAHDARHRGPEPRRGRSHQR